MKRVVEKVRDIVDVRPFTHLSDFSADPALTLGGYHFTDITADLMGKWIDRISRVKPGQGAALALAGFRGVGKSHFLAVVAAIVSRPELRGRISDSHVAQSAESLSRRHGSVAFVRRGLGTSLVDELKRAVAELLGVNPGTLSDSLYDLLLKASEHAGDSTLVVLIDTAQGRETRVARDDGPVISEIAEAADTLGIFVGVALDDDISGADGANSSISGSFSINYLDQEHLYRIVDTHVFTKNSQQLPLLREIYAYYREMMPGFRWSEQRFTSLYPLHPATVEIAPLIRLYIHDFALLGFASEAGVKILGRPANSLIGLDEVFDSVETKLRAVGELKDVFESFDGIEHLVIAKLPVHLRLHAKLVLKGLLMLSLDGQGTTADELAASMMIFSDPESGMAQIDVAGLLDSIVEAMPNAVERSEQSERSAKYSFRLAGKGEANDALSIAAKAVTDETVWLALLKQTADKFSDVDQSAVDGSHPTICSVEWRGSIRRGHVRWNRTVEQLDPRTSDWSIQLKWAGEPSTTGPGEVIWQIADLEQDERDAVCRNYLLQTDAEVRESLGDGLSTALHVHSIAIEKIWQRAFLNDAKIIADGAEIVFSDGTAGSHSLSQLLTPVLGPVFENLYPEHPVFTVTLGQKEVSSLVAEFFGNVSHNGGSQKLAELFAVPLGLAVQQGDAFVTATPEALHELPVISAAFDGVDTDGDAVFSLKDLASRMQAAPIGLTREAQHLVLAALVGQREFEFVTSSGNRISHRSLDLQVIWDDIVGIAKPLNEKYAPERLLAWAKLTTGNSGLRSLEKAEERLLVIDSLSGWLAAWVDSRVLADFDELPDENLNALIWKTAASLKKTFGAMAEAIDLLVKDEISLDKCLHSIAETFSDSEEEFESKKSEMRVLGDFTKSVSRRAMIASYLSICEITNDTDIERSRNALLTAIDPNNFWSNSSDPTTIESHWQAFHSSYCSYYAERHDAVVGKDSAAESLREILASPDWSAFESLYKIPWADQRFATRSRELIREMRQVRCTAKLADVLAEKPFCTCTFELSADSGPSDLSTQLRSTINHGLTVIERQLRANSTTLIEATGPDALRSSVARILDLLDGANGIVSLSGQDLRLLKQAAERAAEGSIAGLGIDSPIDDEMASMFIDQVSSWGTANSGAKVIANP